MKDEKYTFAELMQVAGLPEATAYNWRKRSILRTLRGGLYSRGEVFAAHVGRRLFDKGLPFSWIGPAVMALAGIKDLQAQVTAGKKLLVVDGKKALLCGEQDTIRRDGGPGFSQFLIINLEIELLRFARVLTAVKAMHTARQETTDATAAQPG